ncbi:Torso-like protein, partial [Armadillidium vulgare]
MLVSRFLASKLSIFPVMPFRFNGFNENWLFREKSAEIFQPNSYWAKYSGSNKAGGFDDHFLIDFCDTSKDLYAAYFDHFKIEGIPETYKAFTSFLSNKSKAQALGIYSTYLNSDDFSFVLVRLFRRETRTVLDGDLRLSPEFVNASQRIRIGSTESAHQFMDNFRFTLQMNFSISKVLHSIFCHARRQVKMASGSSEFEAFRNKLKKRYFRFRFYQSIFETLKEKELAEELTKFKGKVITGMRLKKITKALTPTPERSVFIIYKVRECEKRNEVCHLCKDVNFISTFYSYSKVLLKYPDL